MSGATGIRSGADEGLAPLDISTAEGVDKLIVSLIRKLGEFVPLNVLPDRALVVILIVGVLEIAELDDGTIGERPLVVRAIPSGATSQDSLTARNERTLLVEISKRLAQDEAGRTGILRAPPDAEHEQRLRLAAKRGTAIQDLILGSREEESLLGLRSPDIQGTS